MSLSICRTVGLFVIFVLGGCGSPISVPLAAHDGSPVVAGSCEDGGHAAMCTQFVRRRTKTTGMGWTPLQLQKAYNLPSKSRGESQIVAVVDAYDNPEAGSDLAKYRSYFSLPSAPFEKFNQNGERKDYPQANEQWGMDIDQDVEMVYGVGGLSSLHDLSRRGEFGRLE